MSKDDQDTAPDLPHVGRVPIPNDPPTPEDVARMVEYISNRQTALEERIGPLIEHPTRDGGHARLKRAPNSDTWLVMVFGPDNKATTTADGVPVYVQMTEADALALLTTR